MRKMIGCMFFMSLIFLSGCMNVSGDTKDEVAAIVRGEEVMVNDLRLLYPDEVIGEMIDEVVTSTLAKQEVIKMNVDISKDLEETIDSYGTYPEDDETSAQAESIRTFSEPQAEKIGLNPQDYYEQYVQSSAEMTTYVNAYVSTILGGMEDDESGIEEYHHHANEVLDELKKLHSDSIEILLK